MARIRSMTLVGQKNGLHPTEVDCEISLIDIGAEVVIQLSTFGSDARLREKKVSQTIQLSRVIALQLGDLIRATYTDETEPTTQDSESHLPQ